MNKIIKIKHHISDGCCMWSGIEDMYATKRNEEIPEAFLLALSSYGENAYLKFNNTTRPVMFSVCDGRTRKTYDKIKDIIGLDYKISEGRTLAYAFGKVKQEIDNGKPVILGPLDMYYLPYVKMYQKQHIPMHYILMVGYNEEKKCIYLYDCGREEMQELSYEELFDAWQIQKSIVGDKNGFIRFSLSEDVPNVYELSKQCLKQKAIRQLSDKPSFTGITAFYKIANEFPTWKDEMPKEVYQNALMGLVEYFGMVPKLPNRLLGIEGISDISYRGNCDRLGDILIHLGNKYNQADWFEAGDLFIQSGMRFETITSDIVSYLCGESNTLETIPQLFIEIAQLEERAYQQLL